MDLNAKIKGNQN